MTSTQTSSTNPDWRACAVANLLAARKRHGRIGSKKSRFGCESCKSRHVKCDERRPACEKCMRSRRICVYPKDTIARYAPDSERSSSSGSSNSKTPRPALGCQLSQSPCLEHDSRTFHYFLSCAAPSMAGPLDKDFWCGKVLVLAHSEPVIRDGLLALSVLYEHPQFMRSFLITPSGGDYTTPQDHPNLTNRAGGRMDMHYARALRYYNRSMEKLRDEATSGRISPTLALLSCVIFIAVELIRDNVFAALALLNHGVRLTRQLSICPNGLDEGLFTSMKLVMSRLGVLAAIYGHTMPLELLRDLDRASPRSAPADMANARATLTALMEEVVLDLPKATNTAGDQDIRQSRQPDKRQSTVDTKTKSYGPERLYYGCEQKVSSSTECSSIEATHRGNARPLVVLSDKQASLDKESHLLARLNRWHAGFCNIQNVDEQAASVLLMLYHVSVVAASTSLSPTQSAFDHYTFNFQEIIRMAEVYVMRQTEPTTFTFEIGAIGPLYYVATKCLEMLLSGQHERQRWAELGHVAAANDRGERHSRRRQEEDDAGSLGESSVLVASKDCCIL